ncbi:MAG: menaquinone biosynthesis protein [Abditibacteriales bacterium]|nr:menaquinone biosynthesis protein [Abditibacteriales bacterium]MDW8368213.1 menaquinone biosynthesis protein [Abditibacteriales bacterium]
MHFTLGVVSYLNGLPLYRTLQVDHPEQFTCVVKPPSQLVPLLEAGAVDAAQIPIVGYLRGVGEALVPDCAIACDGAVRSVKLFARVPLRQIKRVAVDASSNTSVALLRIVLADRYGLEPEFVAHTPSLDEMLAQHDAALLIGDACMEQEPSNVAEALDLGAEWKALTGLPFVFAAWVTRRGLENATALASALIAAKREGLRRLDWIARTALDGTTLPVEEIKRYLMENVTFDFTYRHLQGLREFARRCQRHGLVEEERAIEFVEVRGSKGK